MTDETRRFNDHPDPEYRAPQAYGAYPQQPQQPPQPAPSTGPQPIAAQYAPPQTPQPVPHTGPQTQQTPPPAPKPSVIDGFDLAGLSKESGVIAVVLGAVLGVFAWVLDLATEKIAEASNHPYALDSVTGYVVYGVAGAVLYLAAVAILLLLYTQVNNPAQVYGWLGLIIPLVVAALLLGVVSWWHSVPLAIMALVAALPVWSVVPIRVRAYYDQQRAAERAAQQSN